MSRTPQAKPAHSNANMAFGFFSKETSLPAVTTRPQAYTIDFPSPISALMRSWSYMEYRLLFRTHLPTLWCLFPGETLRPGGKHDAPSISRPLHLAPACGHVFQSV